MEFSNSCCEVQNSWNNSLWQLCMLHALQQKELVSTKDSCPGLLLTTVILVVYTWASTRSANLWSWASTPSDCGASTSSASEEHRCEECWETMEMRVCRWAWRRGGSWWSAKACLRFCFFFFSFFSGCLFLGPGCPSLARLLFCSGLCFNLLLFYYKDGICFLSHLTSVFPYSKGGGFAPF